MKKKLICIVCPIGCRIEAAVTTGSDEIEVTGNKCSRGEVYAREEALSPKRVVTATVAMAHGSLPRLPVKTDAPLNKEFIPHLLTELYALELEAPVRIGDTVLGDIFKTGVQVVATRNCYSGAAE
ncbi:MAG: DUF1667 domain-containing protein [Spirochaetales bacterium]|jgi:CxxC motif-containing protein|nr:DUF1667 domain-containing protein [Spirochaetales bacterium]